MRSDHGVYRWIDRRSEALKVEEDESNLRLKEDESTCRSDSSFRLNLQGSTRLSSTFGFRLVFLNLHSRSSSSTFRVARLPQPSGSTRLPQLQVRLVSSSFTVDSFPQPSGRLVFLKPSGSTSSSSTLGVPTRLHQPSETLVFLTFRVDSSSYNLQESTRLLHFRVDSFPNASESTRSSTFEFDSSSSTFRGSLVFLTFRVDSSSYASRVDSSLPPPPSTFRDDFVFLNAS
ncbi:unnamed protein product [Pleuronectes platessa]|uniref:Uncharacterized protein n=1 Tax=Pleuronectes platessa TaxID=8262 RepID=A0A9N7UHJ2_PLEPL|nr:unnamed protein product [Pleuronectes platessa]